jgi:hypothetical protein
MEVEGAGAGAVAGDCCPRAEAEGGLGGGTEDAAWYEEDAPVPTPTLESLSVDLASLAVPGGGRREGELAE